MTINQEIIILKGTFLLESWDFDIQKGTFLLESWDFDIQKGTFLEREVSPILIYTSSYASMPSFPALRPGPVKYLFPRRPPSASGLQKTEG